MSQTTIQVNSDFAEWAQLQSGCDGGNTKGSVWLCGIEWGGGDDVKTLNFAKEKASLKLPPERSIEDHEAILKNSARKYTFDHNAYKLISIICLNKKLGEFDYKQYAKKHITYRKDSEFFKANLYPISFKDTSEKYWSSEWQHKTGFPTKHHYILWCWKNRFKSIKSWINPDKPPKLIICVGKTLLEDFLLAFAGLADTPFDNNLDHNS